MIRKTSIDGGATSQVDIGNVSLFFSYNTLIAVTDGEDLLVSDRNFSNTTERHKSALKTRNQNIPTLDVCENELMYMAQKWLGETSI